MSHNAARMSLREWVMLMICPPSASAPRVADACPSMEKTESVSAVSALSPSAGTSWRRASGPVQELPTAILRQRGEVRGKTERTGQLGHHAPVAARFFPDVQAREVQPEDLRLPQPALQIPLEDVPAPVLPEAVADEDKVLGQLGAGAVRARREALQRIGGSRPLEAPLHGLQESTIDLVGRDGLHQGGQ